jgi:hypothetical protein
VFWIGFISTFVYNVSYSKSPTALLLIYPFHKSLRHAIRFLVTDLSQELSFQIAMKTSYHFLFNHLGLPNHQFSSYNSLNPLATNRLSLHKLGMDLRENTCHVSECVFIGPLPSAEHGEDHIENTSSNYFSIVACAHFGRCLEMGVHVTICSSICKAMKKEFKLSIKLIFCNKTRLNIRIQIASKNATVIFSHAVKALPN